MASLNKVLLIGNLTRDPETQFLPSGDPVCQFGIATSEKYTDKSGQKQEKTEFHNIKIFGKLAEIAQQYLQKGAPVYLEGKLQTSKWQDKTTGQDKYKTEIIVEKMQMLGGKRDGDQGQQQAPQRKQSQQSQQKNNPANFDGFEDDLEF